MTEITQVRQKLTRTQKLGRMLKHAVVLELAIYRVLYVFIFRRPRVPAGWQGFRYSQPVLTILIVFLVLSAIEIPVIDMIVHRWLWIRIPLLMLGIWGVTWMLGLLISFVVRPHAVGPEGLLIRNGLDRDIVIPWSQVEKIERHKRVAESSQDPKLFIEDGKAVYLLRMNTDTSIDLHLNTPLTIPRWNGDLTVDVLGIWADDTNAFLRAVNDARAADAE